MNAVSTFFAQQNYFSIIFKWLLICLLTGILAGSASAFFLVSLEWVTQYRENNLWIIALLPAAGLCIGLLYHYYGSDVVKGNNLLIEEYYTPKKIIPFKMAPLVLLGTLMTHLFGGSAGREGTAVQMGGAISELFTKWFKIDLNSDERKIILIIGISAGFASVFGTPWAGAIFGLEAMITGRMRYKAILPAIITAIIADFTCHAWNVAHTDYNIVSAESLTMLNISWTILAGICFGVTAWLFSVNAHFWQKTFSKWIAYAPFRPLAGGALLALVIYLSGAIKYIGLGVPIIVESFSEQQLLHVFLLKIIFTTFTLGAGFKGGEVTPLFFTGATLGSALTFFIPMEISLLAAMGFVAVFAGATNAPLACFVMGIELFGWESAPFLAIACFVAYIFSGKSGIYSAQKQEGLKYNLYRMFTAK